MAFSDKNLVLVQGQYDGSATRLFSYRNPGGDDLSTPGYITQATYQGLRLNDLIYVEFGATTAYYRLSSIDNSTGRGSLSLITSYTAQNPSLWDYIPPQFHAAIRAGTYTDPVGAYIQQGIDQAFSGGYRELLFPSGQFYSEIVVKPKKGVSLIGPWYQMPPSGAYTGTSAEGGIPPQMTVLRPLTGLTAGILFDFNTLPKAERPYGSALVNIGLLGSGMDTGSDLISALAPPTGEGPFNNGSAADAVMLYRCYTERAKRRGISVIGTTSTKVGMECYYTRVSFSGEHGVYVIRNFDFIFARGAVWESTQDGVKTTGCATCRIIENDIFNNHGNGITDDSFDMRYIGGYSQNNDKNGIEFVSELSTIVNKCTKISDMLIAGNSGASALGAYDNVKIGSVAGAGISGIDFSNVLFGGYAHSNATGRIGFHVATDNAPTQVGCTMTACRTRGIDILDSAVPFNDNFWASTVFATTMGASGNALGPKPYTFPVWTGAASPNNIRGGNSYKTANVAGASIIGFAIHAIGRKITVEAGDANTAIDCTGSNIKGNGGVDVAAGSWIFAEFTGLSDGTSWALTVVKTS